MPIATILAVIEALVQFAPQIPEIISAVSMLKTLITEDRAPTADEQTVIDTGLEAAHKALQAAAQPPITPATEGTAQ